MNKKDPDNSNKLRRQLILFSSGLMTIYLVAMYIFWPESGEKPNNALFLVAMFAPTFGALLARYFGGARLIIGKPNKWILVSFIPILVILIANLLSLTLDSIELNVGVFRKSLGLAFVSIPSAMIAALGEEIGWRSFFWPALRNRFSFLAASTITFLSWWIFHLPVILLGWYGTRSGLPAFTVAIAGVTLIIGVITDRSMAIWPSVVLHGAWNALVVTNFGYETGAEVHPAFTGNDHLLGEFGWIVAITTMFLGLLACHYHLKTTNNLKITKSDTDY